MEIIKSDIIALHGAAISMIGGRSENQDDMGYLDTPLGFLIVVCDGMGGGPGGKTASYIVKHEIARALCECSPQIPCDHAFKMAAARAHQALEEEMEKNPVLNGMGSTFVAALINSQCAIIAHAGDSRCYRLHGKKCLFRTHDHSLVAELVRKKVMTEEEARLSPQANVIARGLGSTSNHVPEIDEIPYKKGDRFILCTDGVWGAMPHQKLLQAFTQPSDIQKLLSDISTQVDKIGFLKGGGHDNHTIVAFELETDSQLKDNFSWRRWMNISVAVLVSVALLFVCLWAIFNANGHSSNSISQQITPSADFPAESDGSNYKCSGNSDSGVKEKGIDDDHVEIKAGKNTSGVINKSNQLDETVRNKLLERMRKSDKDSDSISNNPQRKQDISGASKSVETSQKLINRYDSAKAVTGKTVKEAQKELGRKRAEIKELFVILNNQTKNKKFHKHVERISNAVDSIHSWDISKEPDSESKLFVPTPRAQRHMDNQIRQLRELKKNLEKE